jgi:hypothetical protein
MVSRVNHSREKTPLVVPENLHGANGCGQFR